MRTNQVIGPRKAQPQPVYWICLNCGIEQDSFEFLQCENGQLINETLKRALAVLCCSEELIDLIIPPNEQATAPVKKNSSEDLKIKLSKGAIDRYEKKYLEEFLTRNDFFAAITLRLSAKKERIPEGKLSDDNITKLLHFFKPLLTNPEITEFHSSTRICLTCQERLRKEKYDGSDKIPEIPCPICKAILK